VVENVGGTCLVGENLRLEYSIVELCYVAGRSLALEAICLNPFSGSAKEATFKIDVKHLNSGDEKLSIAMSILTSFIKELELPGEVYKLRVHKNKVYFICST
jgi:hypothetical protein